MIQNTIQSTETPSRRGLITAGAAVVALFFLIYLPDIGHGFIKDDYAWIRTSRLDSIAALPRLFRTNVGFYRPLVSASFALDHRVWELNAFGYALTNLAFLLADGLLLLNLARRLRLPPAAALMATGVWLFNFHAVNMALLWISGRTAVLVCFFALAAAHAVLARRRIWGGLFCLAATFCKEEALVLPALFSTVLWFERRRDGTARVRAILSDTWLLWAGLGLYAVLRLQSGAFSPADAPVYYRLTFAPAHVLRTVAEYLDRAATVAIAVSIGLIAAVSRRVTLSDLERRAVRIGGFWFVASYALTIFVPVRSSLYALLPSIGSALAAGAIASWALRANPGRFRQVAAGLLLLTFVLVPVYRLRNARWVNAADLSSRVMQTVADATAGLEGGRIVLVDDPGERFNLAAAFGTLFPDAVALTIEGWSGDIVSDGPPRVDENGGTALIFKLQGRNIVPSSAVLVR